MLQTLASLPKVIEQKTIGGRRLPVTAAVVVDGGGTELWGVLGLRGDRRNLRFKNVAAFTTKAVFGLRILDYALF